MSSHFWLFYSMKILLVKAIVKLDMSTHHW